MRFWEVSGQTIAETKQYDIGIVLGGMAEFNNDLGRLSMRRGGDRIWQALQLYKANKIGKILISGANGHLVDKGLNEALQMKAALVDLGIPEKDILTESSSKNTYENAVESKKIVNALGKPQTTLLITSAIHMRRARACFEAAGFKGFGVFSTDHYTGPSRGYHFDQYIIPNGFVLATWSLLLKEWVGYVTYDIVGYI